MRKILAFLVLLILPWAARGQALADWYYWFDSDKTPRESGKLSAQNTQLNVDVSQLEVGAHMLYFQVVDAAGVSSTPVGNFFYRMPVDNSISKMYYTINGESATHGLDLGNGSFMLDVSKCRSGLNTINIHVADNHDLRSIPLTYLFCKVPPSTKLTKFFYWLDSSTTANELPFGEGEFVIDVSDLHQGFHVVNYCALDDEGLMTDIKSSGFYRLPVESNEKLHYWLDGDTVATEVPNYKDGFAIDVTKATEGLNTIYFQMEDNGLADIEAYHFVKVPQTENGGDMTLVCIIDGKIVGEEKVAAHGGVVKCDMDVSNMEVGLHKAMFQLVTPSGSGSSIAETYFVRTLTTADIASMKCSYTIDGFIHGVQKGACTNGTFHFDLPVDKVEDGLHRLDYRLVADNGASTVQNSEWFYKTPLGGNKIIQYDYWLNSKSDEVQSVQLSEPKDPFQLIKLLPVSKEPIRTDYFHFEVKDGAPMMYAKNDIHFRFHDKSGRWVDADKQYVDYNVSEAVTDIAELQATQTFERLDDNQIKWFRFEAAPGDTIGFKASQATSLQVFAPSGKEILSTMGDKSVQYTGAHTWETGTYYVAVHDVTGSKPNMTLDYMHMDRYDVVDQDVRIVGNGGCSTITFQGNGFKDLYAVDLKDSKGNIIESIDVGHESDASTTVTFDFTGTMLGKYNAVFHFTLEDKTFVNNITVEEAKDIELETKVSYPSTFLSGTSVTYTVEITNKGNMTAYTVPVDLRIITDRFDNISKIHFGDALTSISMPENLDLDSLEQEEIDMIKEVINSADDRCQFIVVNDTVNHKDYGFAQIIATIAPNTTQKLIITIQSSSSVALMAYTTKNWFSVSATESTIRKVKSAKAPSNNSLCCMKEQFQCAADIIASFGEMLGAAIPGVAGGNINCGTAVATTTVSLAFDIGCSDGENLNERIRNYAKSNAGSLANKLISTLVSCVTGYYKPILSSLYESKRIALALKNWNEVERIRAQISRVRTALNGSLVRIYKGVNSGISGVNCFTLSADPIPGCPPNPGGGGGSSSPVNSYDPNDIYGYIAPSGSMYVSEDVVNLPYRIEFENDTTFATSAAHKVVVKDTLDVKVFDLSSYQPTSIKIGEKSVQLKGDKTFVTTVDMRPEINAIAQIEGLYDEKRGIATWQFTSLDPMSMEPTDDIMQGFLPVNFDGRGIGEIAFNINRKAGLADGTEINNRVGIVFDANDPILTPNWTNTIDAVPPTSRINKVVQQNDTIVNVYFNGKDSRSGIWKYDVYVQYGNGSSWEKIAECGADSSYIDFRYYDGINYGFCVLATDAAGNVEKKEFTREGSLVDVNLGDVNSDGEVNTLDASLTTAYYLEQPVAILAIAADVNGDGLINTLDATQIIQMYLNANSSSGARENIKRQRLKTNKSIAK